MKEEQGKKEGGQYCWHSYVHYLFM